MRTGARARRIRSCERVCLCLISLCVLDMGPSEIQYLGALVKKNLFLSLTYYATIHHPRLSFHVASTLLKLYRPSFLSRIFLFIISLVLLLSGKPDDKPWLATYALWGGEGTCYGKFVHGVCIFGVGDLQNLRKRKELFANKFHIDYQPYALDCIEEWHYNKTLDPSLSDLNLTFYANLPFIRKPGQ